MSARPARGTGWIVISGILLLLAGASLVINGLWALHADSRIQAAVRPTLLFSDKNLNTWGWIYVILGAVLLVAGLAVFFRARWAVYFGTAAAFVGMIVAFFWLFTPYWPNALVSIVLDVVVLYGLGTYGIDETALSSA